MNQALLICGLLVAALSQAVRADDTFSVSRKSVITFGQSDGDALGLDEIRKDSVLVLVRPHGEDCTLRFPIMRGENLRLRAVGADGQQLTCQAKLVSFGDEEAQFTARCSEQLTTSNEPKCPPESPSARAAPK